MTEEKLEWMVSGDCVEGCTSPPVCPGYWASPFPKDLHDGESRCEGVWSFNIREGYYRDINLDGLKVCYTFNAPAGFPEVMGPWRCIIFIDDAANDGQAEALEKIYRECWARMGEVLKVKRGEISFTRELIDGGPAARHAVEIKGVYNFKMDPLLTGMDKKPRYIVSGFGGKIYVGKSEINEFKDTDLPHTWNRPGMSCTYHDFTLSPKKPFWQP